MRTLALSLFGLLVTVALATYNQRNDQLYDTLIERAASIERELELPDGVFANRPNDWFAPLRLWKVNHRWPVALIYGGSVALWLYSAIAASVQIRVHGDKSAASETLLLAAGAAVAATVLVGLLISKLLSARRRAICAHAKAAVDRILSNGTDYRELAECNAFLADCGRLSGTKEDKVKKRILAYTDPDQVERNRRYLLDSPDPVDRAAAFVALLSDLPPQWIADCYTGRRAA